MKTTRQDRRRVGSKLKMMAFREKGKLGYSCCKHIAAGAPFSLRYSWYLFFGLNFPLEVNVVLM